MKKETESKGGWGFIVVAVIALAFGVAVAAAQLAMRSVPEEKTDPGDHRGKIDCVRSTALPTPGYSDRARKVWHAVPGHYVFSEGDINALVSRHLSNVVAIDGVETIRVEELPNVRMLEGGHVLVSTVVSLPAVAGNHRFVYQVRGHIVPGGFSPEMGWFGQCPVPFFNMNVLQAVRRQILVDRDVTGLSELRKKILFSRKGDSIVVDVVDTK